MGVKKLTEVDESLLLESDSHIVITQEGLDANDNEIEVLRRVPLSVLAAKLNDFGIGKTPDAYIGNTDKIQLEIKNGVQVYDDGDFYINNQNGKLWKCTSATHGEGSWTYSWRYVGNIVDFAAINNMLSGKYNYVVAQNGVTADDCTEIDTLYRVYINSGIVSTGYLSLTNSIAGSGKITQYAQTNDGFIITRSKPSGGGFGAWKLANPADNALSPRSTNPIQNKVVFEALQKKMTLLDPEIDGLVVPANVDKPDITSQAYSDLDVGQIFICVIDNKLTYWVKQGTLDCMNLGSGGGLAFERINYDSETGYLHIYDKNGEDVVDPTFIGGGGGSGGGGSTLTFACYTSPSFTVLDTAASAPIQYKFTSIDNSTDTPTGSGTMKITVGGVVKTNITVQQGDNLILNVLPYLVSGTNTVKLTITDSYGASATRTFTIVVESFAITWSLNDTQLNTESELEFTFTPTGNGTKTIYTYVDGVLDSTDTVTTSGRKSTKRITGLAHGGHTIELYGTMEVGGSTLESNHLTAAIAHVVSGNSTPVVAVNWPSGNLKQYTAVSIPYYIYDPSNNPATVSLKEGQTEINSLSVDRTPHTWTYRPTSSGSVTISVVCRSTTVSKTFNVQALQIRAQEVTDGLICKVDPSTISDLSNWSNNGYSFSLSQGFDLVNGGLTTDSDGIQCIRITAGDYLTLNYDPFASNPITTGREIKIIYKIDNTASKTAVGISSMNNNRGLKVQANNAYLYGNQNSVELSLCEGQKTELDVTIQQKTNDSDRLMYLWERCSTFAFEQYATDENFAHSSNVGITFGSEDADVYLYLFRAYSRDLTSTEMRNNYIVDGPDGDEIYKRDNRNAIYDGNGVVNFDLAAAANPNCHFILINAEKISTAKKKNGGTVSGTLRHVYAAGGAAHTFTADLNMDLQGTSSEEHANTAGPNLNLRLYNGIVLDDGTELPGYAMHGEENSIAVNLFNYKKNIASQDHIVNRVSAERYNRFQPSIRQAREYDPRVRDCLECTMCAVFFHNTSNSAVQVGPDLVQPNETIFFGLGNLCSSKDCYETFEYDDIVIEVKNNTEDQVRFKSKDLSGDNFDNNYEFRYLNEDEYSEAEAIQEWQTVQSFIYDTDYTEATDDSLPSPVTINGTTYNTDSEAYRKAKWIAEAPTIFDMDTLYWHHVITLFFLLRDNRAKNMFWSKSKDTGKWGLWFNWDNDTGLCRNNRGYVDMEPGYMDWDTLGTSDVFNAADNALFTNLRENNFAQLKAMYVDREAEGAWDIYGNDGIYKYCVDSQEQICESLWIEDAEHNAIRILENLGNSNYLGRATGKLQLHVLKSLIFQKALVDSYFSSKDCEDDRASLRGNAPQDWQGVEPSGLISITPYTNMFINIKAGSRTYRQRAYEGVPISFDISAALNDTEMYLYSAEWIQGFGDLSALYLSQFEIGTMKRVQSILLGSNVEGYSNNSNVKLDFSNCIKLKTLNLAGLTNTAKSVDFSNNIYLESIDTRGSAFTGLRFAKNGRLVTALLNGLNSLYMSGLRNLQTFSIESYSNLETLTVEDCAAIDTKAIVLAASALQNIRFKGISWSLDNTSLLFSIKDNLGGLDDSGDPTDNAVLKGLVHVAMISVSAKGALESYFGTGFSIEYDTEIPSYSVTFKGYDGTTLNTQTVERGSAPVDPLELPTPIATPSKPDTRSKTYTFDGWSWTNNGTLIEDLSQVAITQNSILYAHFDERQKQYTVTWKNGTTVLETQNVDYGESAEYTGQTDIFNGVVPQNASDGDYATYYQFKGWDKSTANITENIVVNAVFESAGAPQTKTFDQMTPTELHALIETGVLSPTGANNTMISSGDTNDIIAGNDYDFDNVDSHELVSLGSPQVFDGASYYKPQINGNDIFLFKTDKSFTLAIDFAYSTSSQAGGCLASCYHSNGFQLRYNSGGSVRYGSTVAQQVSSNGVRQITVIRKIAGDPNLYVYGSNKNGNDIVYSALSQSSAPTHNAPLCFGAMMMDDGYLDNYGTGTVFWAKLWDDDLGDTVCKDIAQWPRQTFTMQAVGSAEHAFRSFVRADNDKYPNLAVLLKDLLEETHQMDPANSNSGGWKPRPLRTWLNSRILRAIPILWRQLIVSVYVHSNTGQGATGIVDPPAVDKIWIPSCKDMGFQVNTSPYSLESDATFTIFTNDASRVKKLNFGTGAASNWWLRSPSASYGSYFWYVGTSGSGNSNGANYSYGVAFGFCI